ncbi:hypothetical protein AB0L74_32565 [Streptomyces sp. NPDC052020]|uniref:hypothetical protein n=1 Tax=Streptomyces sp. NPDC052020 TaxID=3155677 RepID=UPI00343D74CC
MTEIGQAQLRQEEMDIALWQTPPSELDDATTSKLSQLASASTDKAVGHQAVGDGSSLPDLGSLGAFGTWESVATTIWHKAESISGFDPGSTTFNVFVWSHFIEKFGTIPFFLRYTTDYVTLGSISSLSLRPVVAAAWDLLQPFVTRENSGAVTTTIRKMAQLAVENKVGGAEKSSNQMLGVLSRYHNNLYLGLVTTVVKMNYKEGKGYEPLQQAIQMYRGYGLLDFDKCKRHADNLLEWDGQDVTRWACGANSASLPPNQSPAWDQ